MADSFFPWSGTKSITSFEAPIQWVSCSVLVKRMKNMIIMIFFNLRLYRFSASYSCILIITILICMKSCSVYWNRCFADISPQSWPLSLNASSLRGGDVRLADSSTWWHAIQSSQRTSCWRPSSPSTALYVAPVQPRSLWDRACSVVNVSIALPQDVQTKLRDAYKRTGDEFMTNRIATRAKVCCAFS